VGRAWAEGYREWASKEGIKGLRVVYSEQLHDVYALQNVVSCDKIRRFKLAGRVVCMEEYYIEDFGGKT
jgi:hypothetical protein